MMLCSILKASERKASIITYADRSSATSLSNYPPNAM
jgi:hypothetical protein